MLPSFHSWQRGSTAAVICNLQAPALFEQLLLLPRGFDGLRALGQGRRIEQGQQRRQAVAVDQPEDFDIALRRYTPPGDVERPLRF
jgi:hypothetical protein